MTNAMQTRPDSTVTFLPHRLNRQPVIVRGLTANELWIMVCLSALGGLVLGVVLAVLVSSVAVAPTAIVASIGIGVFLGGGILRRQKRGRPDTWLYRQIQWRVCQRSQFLSGYLGGDGLIRRSGFWTTRRVARP